MGGILKFIQVNWKFFAGAILVALAVWAYNYQIDQAYEKGKVAGIEAQKKQCDEDFQKMENNYKEKVAALEDETKRLGDALTESNRKAAERLDALAKKLAEQAKKLDSSLYNSQGLRIKCEDLSESQEFYLGKDFSDLWNAQTREAFIQ